MVLVAVAGGTSPTLGRAIVAAIINAGTHKVVILSRASTKYTSNGKTRYGAALRYVDYSSIPSIVEGLQGVHTLISVLDSPNPAEMIAVHTALIEGAKTAGVKRFAPSEFGMGPLGSPKVDILRPKLAIWAACKVSGLECTRFVAGMFMNYLGVGCALDKRKEALAGLDNDDFMLDVLNIADGHVVIPLNANGKPARVSMCELTDIGRFVAAALDLEHWEEEMSMEGSTATMEEVVWVAERIGRLVKMERATQAQFEEQAARIATRIGGGVDGPEARTLMRQKALAQIMACTCDDTEGSAVNRSTLNKLCPEVSPMGFEEYLVRYCSKARVWD